MYPINEYPRGVHGGMDWAGVSVQDVTEMNNELNCGAKPEKHNVKTRADIEYQLPR